MLEGWYGKSLSLKDKHLLVFNIRIRIYLLFVQKKTYIRIEINNATVFPYNNHKIKIVLFSKNNEDIFLKGN